MHGIVDVWLTRFAAGAGSEYRWRGLESEIRACLPEGAEMCPLAAQATYEHGTVCLTHDWMRAADLLDLPDYASARIIVDAADDDPLADPEVRQRLLQICRLAD